MSPRMIGPGMAGTVAETVPDVVTAAITAGVAAAAMSKPTAVTSQAMAINGAARQPSLTNAVAVATTIRASIGDGSDGSALLEVSANGATGWAAVGKLRNSFDVGGLLGVSGTSTIEVQLNAIVPPGWYYRLTSTGSGSKTFVSNFETVM